MKWRQRKQSTNVDDRRSRTGGTGRSLPSIGTLLFLWPVIKKLLSSKLGIAILIIGAAVYFLDLPSLIGGGSSTSTINEELDNEQAAFIKTVH